MDVASRCRYETARLRVDEWHAATRRLGLDLARTVSEVLTEATTAALPAPWRGDFSLDRAIAWIAERDAEGPTQLITSKEPALAVGLLIVFESPTADDGIDLRVGYVMAEQHWGRGFASELVSGLVDWASSQPEIQYLTGGVDESNVASARVLTKAGFQRTATSGARETMYQLTLTGHNGET